MFGQHPLQSTLNYQILTLLSSFSDLYQIASIRQYITSLLSGTLTPEGIIQVLTHFNIFSPTVVEDAQKLLTQPSQLLFVPSDLKTPEMVLYAFHRLIQNLPISTHYNGNTTNNNENHDNTTTTTTTTTTTQNSFTPSQQSHHVS